MVEGIVVPNKLLFRTSAGRADVHGLLAAGKFSVRNNHCFDRKSDHSEEAVSILDEGEKALRILECDSSLSHAGGGHSAHGRRLQLDPSDSVY